MYRPKQQHNAVFCGGVVGCGLIFFPLFSCAIATVFNNANQHINVYGDDIEVDYRGYEVC